MEHHLYLTVLGLTGLLGLAVLMLPAANKLDFPYTVLLAAVGVSLGLVLSFFGDLHGLGPVGDFLGALKDLEITSEIVLFVFLPALVFESALAIDVRRLMDDIAPILLLAIVGLLISTAIVGYSLYIASGMALVVCLLLGAIVSATDPVAVVAIFKDLGAPKRLAILVEGESLFNDATAIVVFTLLSAMLMGEADPTIGSGIMNFLIVFIGGIVVGYLCARLGCFILGWLRGFPVAEITMTISLAYLSFIVAEHYLHVSGVMAVVTAALVIGSIGRTTILPSTWHGLTETWEQIGFWANSIIFILVGLAIPVILAGIGLHELGLLAILLAAAFGARALIIFGLLPLFGRTGWALPVSTGYASVMFWGGLRGAVSLALALAIMENNALDEDIRGFVGMLVTGFVLFTLFINATTIGFVLRMFGLDKLSPADMAIRNRALAASLTGIGTSLSETASRQDLDRDLADSVINSYAARAEKARDAISQLEGVNEDDWVRIGLSMLSTQESMGYLQRFDQGFVSSNTTRILLARSNDNLDALKTNGEQGYKDSVAKALSFDWRFHLSMAAQRRFGVSGPLARQLQDRFAVLLATRTELRRLLSEGMDQVASVVAATSLPRIKDILMRRLDETEKALAALKLQYPEYARLLQQRYLGLVAIRLEQAKFSQMKGQALIGKEVYKNLSHAIDQRQAELDSSPQLDLGLDPHKLIQKVPFFAGLSEQRTAELARLLQPRLAIPGEKIVHKGGPGDAMYFVSNGAIEVQLEPDPVQLGSGDFFGEIALLSDKPRNADVVAKGFCDLLTLWVKDFKTLTDEHPEMRETIEQVARDRLGYKNT